MNSEILGEHSVGIDTAFATMSETPTQNLGVLVQARGGWACTRNVTHTGWKIVCLIC